MSVSFSCPRCSAAPLDPSLRCPTCETEHGSVRVDDGSAVAVLLDTQDAQHGLAATTRVLEALDGGPSAVEAIGSTDADVLSALATYGGAHFGRWAQPPLPTPDLGWVPRALEQAEGLPDGPALILGAATAGEALVLGERETIALDGSVPLLAFASGLTAADQWLPVQTTPGRYGLRRLVLPSEVRERLRRVTLVAADARRPPLPTGGFALIVALNLLDSITHPRELLLRAQALLAPGGALLVSTPYNWNDDVTAPPERLDAGVAPRADRAAEVEARVAALLPQLRLTWSDRDVPWRLRIHDRLVCEFRLHAMLLRRDERA